jgi:hypothetical protein
MVKIVPTTTMITVWSIAAMVFADFAASQQKPDLPEAVAPPENRNSLEGLDASSEHRHSHEGLTWPPQPRDISDIVVRSNIEEEKRGRAREKLRMDRLEAKAKTTTGAKRALGKQFTLITVIDREDKETRTVISQLVFFSRDQNATVEVSLDKDEKVQAVNSIPAQEYQPDITEEETEEATALARSYFRRQGLGIAGLKAYGILAYKPQGVGFFDTRVLYVSFHKHDNAPPELSAWVDLTNQLVLQTLGE